MGKSRSLVDFPSVSSIDIQNGRGKGAADRQREIDPIECVEMKLIDASAAKLSALLGSGHGRAVAEQSTSTVTHSAEGTGPKTLMGVSVSPVMAGTIGIGIGALVGWMATDRHYKAKLDSLNIRIQEMESNIKEAERAIKRAERNATKAAESHTPAPFNPKEALDNHFLSEFNYRNGPSY